MPVRVGIDLVEVDEIRASLDIHGSRYLERVYTEAEQRDCAADARRLAKRFAAKEATMKALLRDDSALPWRSIEVVEDASGRLAIKLAGNAAALARRRGVRRLALSSAMSGPQALAIVFANLNGP